MPRLSLILAALLATLPAGVAADVYVEFLRPRPQEHLFDEVVVEVMAFSDEPIATVEIFLGDRRLATLTERPFRMVVDVGADNVDRTFRAVATTDGGRRATARLLVPKLEVGLIHDARLQQLYVTVETATGQRFLDLERGGFVVHDNRRRQEIVLFERGDVPLTAALLIDASLSMRGEPLRAAIAGARAFVEAMAELDEAMVLLFSHHVLRHAAFTGETDQLVRSLESVEAHGGSAINDHLYLALRKLERHQGRRVAILLSDGIDIESVFDVSELVHLAQRSQTMIYWLRLGEDRGFARADRYSAWRDASGHRAELRDLERLVEATGGRVLLLHSLGEIEPAFREVLAELRDQYVLGYYPRGLEGPGTWHQIRVWLDRGTGRGLRVRTTDGYIER